MFLSMLENNNFELTGLLNYNRRWLEKSKTIGGNNDKIYYNSRIILSLSNRSRSYFLERASERLSNLWQTSKLLTFGKWLNTIKVHDLNTDVVGEFVWQNYFTASLPPTRYDLISSAKYAAIRPPWSAMHSAGMIAPFKGRYPVIDTRPYDVFIAQTPWPGVIGRQTRLVVRYHDAIPVLYPQTIQNPHIHQIAHYFSLLSNLRNGALVVCNSENSRNDLLQIFPQFEKQASVIPCAVPDNHDFQYPSRKQLSDIIQSNIEPSTEPIFSDATVEDAFYARNLDASGLRFLVMVSTIEPRKNHRRLISAWNQIRASYMPDLKLVIIGKPGWNVENTLETMKPHQRKGQLFHLTGVSSPDLHKLYNGAEAVICPSIAEGFDLSGVEAMLCGGKVAASDIPVHREIYEDACEYFDPYSTQQAVDAIMRIISEDANNNRSRLVERGAAVGAKFQIKQVKPLWDEFLLSLSGSTRNGAG